MIYKTDISTYNPASNDSWGLQLHQDNTNNAKIWRYIALFSRMTSSNKKHKLMLTVLVITRKWFRKSISIILMAVYIKQHIKSHVMELNGFSWNIPVTTSGPFY